MIGAEIIPVEPGQGNACVGRSKFHFLSPTAFPLNLLTTKFKKMKRIVLSCCTIFTAVLLEAQVVPETQEPSKAAKDSFYLLSPVEVRAVRAGENAPFTKTNISKREIAKTNLGQDIPFILNQTPSVVVNSDAGNGIGYTGIRIRGTDATRINVTLNGIPYNDAESQGSFFVDLPDFSSSASSIQIQRGVGTSSNGAGAFGASINFSTNELNKQSYAEFNNSFGSFNTRKHTIKLGTGLLKERFTTDLRLSLINSDGFIDRATSALKSFHFSTAYSSEKTTLRFNIFSGHEKTYQAWNGVSEADLKAGRRRSNSAGTEKPGEPYENETDNYQQDHYQLFFTRQLKKNFQLHTAVFYTKGKGYYEQYKADEPYLQYGLANPGNSDFIRQLWLDNDFYGSVFSLHFKKNKVEATLGGGYTRYEGDHFGKLIWASNGLAQPSHRWYDVNAFKSDLNIYLKQQMEFSGYWWFLYDLQFRHVNYAINGFRENPSLLISNQFNFFNPKVGISYIRSGWKGYFSYGMANKEPNRDDFETGMGLRPKPERLYDFELGVEKNKSWCNWGLTFYYMRYKNQLILTGRINDVGAYTRTNVPHSYRLGAELHSSAKLSSWMNIAGNLALSSNKLLNFTEYIDDYDNGVQKQNLYSKTDIAFAPSIVGGASLNFIPVKDFELSLLSKYVNRQFLDNTANNNRKLDPFYVQDLRIIYTMRSKFLKEISILGQVNNLLNNNYEPNGYTYNYIYGGELSVNNYYFPMAGVNFLFGINLNF
jgi:iron complex outermembrane recepter protein